MKASKFVPRPALVVRGDKDAPTSDTDQEKGGRGQNTALRRQKTPRDRAKSQCPNLGHQTRINKEGFW